MTYLMGVDLGTSSVKVMIIDELGNSVACASKLYDFEVPQLGYAEQNGDELWKATVDCIRKALSQSHLQSSQIQAVGLSGQMHGLVLLNAEKKLISPIIIWLDQRSKEQVVQLQQLHIQESIRNPINTGFYLPSLLWIKDNEKEKFEKIRYAILPKDYIRFKLCGEIGTDYSDASGTLLLNSVSCKWDNSLANSLGIDPDILPECHWAQELAGHVYQSAADETGLRKGTPVAYGGGDGPMQLIGNGAVNRDALVTNIGTASQIDVICNSSVFDPQERINVFCHGISNQWIAMAASLNGGYILNWLKSNILTDIVSYNDMDQYAAESPAGCNGLIFLPYLCGERSPHMDADARGIAFGLTISHNRNHLIRACMESIVYAFREGMEIFNQLNIPISNSIIASGGGARSSLWLQMQADILQKEIVKTQNKEEACLGAAIVAGVSCGLYSSIQEGCNLAVHLSDNVIIPNPHNNSVYEENYQKYRLLYDNNCKLFK